MVGDEVDVVVVEVGNVMSLGLEEGGALRFFDGEVGAGLGSCLILTVGLGMIDVKGFVDSSLGLTRPKGWLAG